jgi:acyl-coenzyme A synthetase/AMP-(fatty) acid ligase
VFVDALPRLGNGKIDRMTLAQWAREPDNIGGEAAV